MGGRRRHVARNIAEISWTIVFHRLAARKRLTGSISRRSSRVVKSLARNKTKAEFGAAARKLGLLASPVLDMKDVAESAQYRERGLFTSVDVAPGREIDVPARFAQFSNFSIET